MAKLILRGEDGSAEPLEFAPSTESTEPAPEQVGKKLVLTGGDGLGAVTAGTTGFNDFVLALPDAAINTALWGLRKAGIISPDETGDGRDVLNRVFNNSSYEDKERILGFIPYGTGQKKQPEGLLEKSMYAGGQGLAAGMTFAGGAGAAAAKSMPPLPRGVPSSSVVTNLSDDIMSAYRSAPAVAAGAEAASSTLGGVGSELGGTAEEALTGQRSGIGALAGGVIGGSPLAALHGIAAVPGVKPAAMGALSLATGIPGAGLVANYGAPVLKGATNMALDRFMPSRAQRSFGKKVNKEFGTAYENAEDKGILGRTDEIYKRFDEAGLERPKLDAAQETLDPGLAREKARINLEARGPKARENQELVNTNVERVRGFLDQTVPHRDDDAPSMVIDVLKGKATKEMQDIDTEAEYLTRSADVVNQRLPRQDSITERGRTIREAINADKEAASQEMDQLAEQLGINLKGPGRGFQGIKQDIKDNFFERNSVLQKGVPRIIRDIANMEEGKLNFQEWKKFKDRINSDLQGALGNNNSAEAVQLTKFKKYWDDIGDRAFGDMGENWKTFKQAYEERYMPYEKGAAYRITQSSSDSRPGDVRFRTVDEQVADAFFKSEQDAKDFMKLTEDQPEARVAMKDIILDKVRDFAGVGKNHPFAGSLDPQRVRMFMDKNRDTLAVLGLDKDLENYNTIMDDLVKRNAELTARKELIAKDSLNKLLVKTNKADNSFDEGDVRADDIIAKATGDRVLMKSLIKRIGEQEDNVELMKAFRESVSRQLIGDKELLETNPEQFLKNFNKNRDTLEMALGKQHVKDLELIADAYKRVRFGNENIQGSGVATKSLPDRIKDFLGISPESLESRIREARSGRVAPQYVIFALSNRFMTARNRRIMDAMIEKAMKDPESARLLASPTQPDGTEFGAIPKATERRLKAWMLDTGVEATKEAAGVEEPQYKLPPEPLERVSPPPSPQQSPAPEPSAPGNILPQPMQQQGQAPQTNAQEYAALFPNDSTGIAIAGRQGYAEGGFVREGWRPSENVEDRRADAKKDKRKIPYMTAVFPSNIYGQLRDAPTEEDKAARARAEDSAEEWIRNYDSMPMPEDPFMAEMSNRLRPPPKPSMSDLGILTLRQFPRRNRT